MERNFSTLSLHTRLSKEEEDGSTSVVPSITNAATFKTSSDYILGQGNAYCYGRYGNTTRNTLEATIAKLEGAAQAFAFSSGMAATSAVVDGLLKQGDEVVASKQMYGGTYSLFTEDLHKFGVCLKLVDKSVVDDIVSALTSKTRLVWLEVCSNPLLKILDLALMVKAIKGYKSDIIICIDNTFLSPFIVKPLSFGVDMVMHSMSKYYGGHSDIIMGCLAMNDPALGSQILRAQRMRGGVPSAFDCYLMIRSIYTLEIRMMKHHENALAVANFLADHPGVAEVVHPLLANHPSHDLAQQQHGGLHSGMIAFTIKGGKREALAFFDNLKFITYAVSLGGVHSLISHPMSTTHSFLKPEDCSAVGIHEGTVRFSVGIENVEDIKTELNRALRTALKLEI
ncbi:hypothetical protein TCAL_11796 [Tigriopus californicus]|uniref:Uncharacterized protein n=1 Tax=Tigriopus californicus TaxID=6832 RepID=A0A553PM61_TIGCA|nr:cystathionine gamma-lyase-like [Tigriopus californicus]TRY78768.1 hypothetical protein TCAL_11796 [Tigriopus californicus]|eukprot:TCALIF_11796-PB protein Name:"Similar to Cth Cystathionine gamma-lyase (Mus musculus)" AED:0.05 eAED:0.05 QI:100/1/1/1/0.8/1/6/70/396